MTHDEMVALFMVGGYILVAILYVIIGSLTFKPLEGDYEFICGVACEKDEEIQRGELVARAFLWPLTLAILVILGPFILLDRLSSKCYYRNKGNNGNNNE